MKKLLMILILFSTNLSSQNVEETEYECGRDTGNPNKDKRCFVKGSLTINKDLIIFWMMDNFKEPRNYLNKSYRSTKFKILHDCKMDRFKILVVNNYDSPMGKGELVNSFSDDKWNHPEPGEFFYRFNKDICVEHSK